MYGCSILTLPVAQPLFTTATLSSLSYTHTHMQTHAHTDACVHARISCLTLYKRHKVCLPVWVAQLTGPVTVWEEERLLEYMLNLLFWLFCRITYIELSRISSDRWSNQKLYFFLSRIDYCNSLLTDIPKCLLARLQGIQNSAGCFICWSSTHNTHHPLSSLSSLIVQYLHFPVWLIPVTGTGPRYLYELILIYIPASIPNFRHTFILNQRLLPCPDRVYLLRMCVCVVRLHVWIDVTCTFI